jgi:hypothetical protein
MEPAEKVSQSAKKGRRYARDTTIMIVRGVGNVHAFQISSRVVLWAVIFFLLYIPASVFVIHEHYRLYRMHIARSGKIVQLEEELSKNNRDIHSLEQHIVILKDTIANSNKKEKREAPPATNGALPREKSSHHAEAFSGHSKGDKG